MDELKETKYDKEAAKTLLPPQDVTDANIVRLARIWIQKSDDKFEEQVDKWDQKIINLRKEFDMGKINKALKGKADLNESTTQFQNLQYSLSVLEMRHNQLHIDTNGLVKGAKLFESRVH